jgi:hypothetical protein
VAHVLGARAFHRLVHRYIAAVALTSYNLNDAGAELPRFLRGDSAGAALPFLPDLAQLEWAVVRAFHAHENVPLDPASLADRRLDDWAGAVLRFQPWLSVVQSNWPIRALWECRETRIEEIDIDLNDRPDRVLVRRVGATVVCESLDCPEGAALSALIDGQSLGTIVTTLAADGIDAAAVATWFARWMAWRAVVGCDFVS